MTKKPKFNQVNMIISLLRYGKLSKEKQYEIRNKRFKNIIKYAKENSEFYKNLYKDIDIDNFSIEDISKLPITTKETLQNNFDNWLTTDEIKEEDIKEFLKDTNNFTKKYLNKYAIYQTSGTTGSPVTVINDANEVDALLTIGLTRSWSLSALLKMFQKGLIITCILPVKTPCISTFLATRASEYKINKNKLFILDMEKDMKEIVNELNRIQPVEIGGYCTYIEMLVEEAQKGNLKINPLYITTVGEKLTNEIQEKISKTFNSCTFTNYACTECAEIAYMCEANHYHINDDWIIVEPVDENNNPVPPGVLSHKILVTNLFNYTQPFIRYEINDRVILHNETCLCNKYNSWLEVEGREFKVVNFDSIENTKIKVSPISIEIMIHKNDEGIQRYQFIKKDKQIIIKLQVLEGFDKQTVFNNMKKNIEEFLFENAIVPLEIILSDEPPKVSKNGKFKQVYEE